MAEKKPRKRKSESIRCADGANSRTRRLQILLHLAASILHSSFAAATTIRRGTMSWDQATHPMLPNFTIVVEQRMWRHPAALPALIFHTMMNKKCAAPTMCMDSNIIGKMTNLPLQHFMLYQNDVEQVTRLT